MLILPVCLEPVAKFASSKTSKFQLDGVHVEQRADGSAVVTATDTHTAIEVVVPDGANAEGYPEVPSVPDMTATTPVKGIIPARFWTDTFAAAKRLAKRIYVPSLKTVAIVQRDANTVQAVTYSPTDGVTNAPVTSLVSGKFPPVSGVIEAIRQKVDPVAVFSVDAPTLAGALTVLAKLAKLAKLAQDTGTTGETYSVTVEVRQTKTEKGEVIPHARVLKVDSPLAGLQSVTALMMLLRS